MIPDRHRADEFSLQLSWNPRVSGVVPPTPGWYVRASFANEGEATSVVRGSWDDGRAGNGSLVGEDFMLGLFSLLSRNQLLKPQFPAALGSVLATYARDAQHTALLAKRSRLERLRGEVAALEQELGA